MKKIIVAIICMGVLPGLLAQDENLQKNFRVREKTKTNGISLLVAGVETSTTSYINTNTLDSNSTRAYLSAYVTIQHSSNFGLQVKTYALPGGSDPGFYLTSLSPFYASYQGKLVPYISYTRYLYHNNPSVPYSPIQNDIYAQVRFKTKIVDPLAGLDIGFGNDKENNNESVSDVNAFLGISHIFSWEFTTRNTALGIIPSLQLNAGTDRYFKFTRSTKYISQNRTINGVMYGNRRGMGGSGGGGGMPTGETYSINVVNDFSVSNLEANLYLLFFIGDLSIEPSGSLYFPLRGEDRTAFGYWQINLQYWFK